MSRTLFTAIFAAAAALAAAMPADMPDFTVPNRVDLDIVLNKTVCPIQVDMDVDLNRIPKRIKVLKCAKDPNQWCSKMHIPKHECCQHQHDLVRLECVEVEDIVHVYYPKHDVTRPYRVAVGCACVMQTINRVLDAEPSR